MVFPENFSNLKKEVLPLEEYEAENIWKTNLSLKETSYSALYFQISSAPHSEIFAAAWSLEKVLQLAKSFYW